MYIFEAHYINFNTDDEIVRTIEFSENCFQSEKECFIYAMSRAYDIMNTEIEFLSKIEFIAC